MSLALPAAILTRLEESSGRLTRLYHSPLWIPSFPDVSHGRWTVSRLPMGLMQGYWGDSYVVTDAAVLLRNDVTWMSVTPPEIESQELGCRLAHGHVVVLGFGMGIAAANAALNPAVTAVTVVELDPEIHAFAADLDLPAQLPPEAAAKLRLISGDATRWCPDPARPVDVILADYWLPFFDSRRIAEMQAVQVNIQATQVFFWGQELSLAWALYQTHGTVPVLDDTALEAFITHLTPLPLLWPRGVGYGQMLVRAAAARMPPDLRAQMFPPAEINRG